MDEKTLQELQYGLETQFRYKLYKDFKFKYMQSVGIKDIMQAFQHPELGFIGVLHLFWCTDEGKPYWKSKWLDADESITVAQQLQNKKLYDENKLVECVMNFIKFKYIDQFNITDKLI